MCNEHKHKQKLICYYKLNKKFIIKKMDIIIRTGFAAITYNKIKFTSEAMRKGKEIYEARHIRKVEELQGISNNKLIRCEMRHSFSVNEKDYKVSFEVSIINNNLKINYYLYVI